MNRTYRTTKGTELPILSLRGKDYLEVKYRLVWFREEHPDWSIETDLLSVTDQSAYARATIKDENGRVIATSHKFENRQGFPDFIEKAETGAIGRALALIGFGTQFCADELDEGDRIVDAPVDLQKMAPQQRSRAHEPETSFQEAAFDPNESFPSTEGSEGAEEAAAQKDPGDYQITFGRKYKGMKLRDIPKSEIEGYVDWLEANAAKKGMPLSDEARYLKVAVGRYLSQDSH